MWIKISLVCLSIVMTSQARASSGRYITTVRQYSEHKPVFDYTTSNFETPYVSVYRYQELPQTNSHHVHYASPKIEENEEEPVEEEQPAHYDVREEIQEATTKAMPVVGINAVSTNPNAGKPPQPVKQIEDSKVKLKLWYELKDDGSKK